MIGVPRQLKDGSYQIRDGRGFEVTYAAGCKHLCCSPAGTPKVCCRCKTPPRRKKGCVLCKGNRLRLSR